MPADPDRYLGTDELEREIPFDAIDFDVDDETEDADGNTEWDNLLLGILDRESGRIEKWANTVYEVADASATLEREDHVPNRDLPLSNRPIQSVTSVTVGGDAIDIANIHAAETHLVLLDDASISSWPTTFRSVDVEWTYGFESVPGPVEDALIRLCRNALERIQTDGLNQEQIVGGGMWNYRVPSEVLGEANAVVSAHSAPSYDSGVMVI